MFGLFGRLVWWHGKKQTNETIDNIVFYAKQESNYIVSVEHSEFSAHKDKLFFTVIKKKIEKPKIKLKKFIVQKISKTFDAHIDSRFSVEQRTLCYRLKSSKTDFSTLRVQKCFNPKKAQTVFMITQ